MEKVHVAERTKQQLFSMDIAEIMRARVTGRQPLARVQTYGCQQNVADGEKIKGMLYEMGFDFTEEDAMADVIIFNTCAVREHAQERVFGMIGKLKHLKAKNPELLIAVCGCMTEQQEVSDKIKNSYPFVNIVFGTHMLHRLPEILFTALTEDRRVFLRGGESNEIYEGIPTKRDGNSRAWVTVMYGCNNYCSFCIVPHVRGREKSRQPDDIYDEVKSLVEAGYKEITLLGQNVNSYGKTLREDINFAGLLRLLDTIDGDFRIRFMSSHPKDASIELFDTMAQSRHIPHYFHLPLQSGNDQILKTMNRQYDREKYLSLVRNARQVMPDISFTSDIIVGFPGETYEQFQDTLSVVAQVGYISLFTFIYSSRPGTRAAEMEDLVTHKEKTTWYAELLRVQEQTVSEYTRQLIGKTARVLVEGRNAKTGLLSGRTESFMVVEFPGGDHLIDEFTTVKITKAYKSTLWGEQI